MKEKLVYISNARIIGILLVVFGHSYPLTGEIPKALDAVRNFIYCFHMPLFVFISGYLVSKTGSVQKYGTKQYIQKRFIKLFVPYIGLSILGFFPKILMSGFINDEVELSITYFVRTLLVPRENVWGHFWFIPMLFVMAVVSVFYANQVKNKRLAIIICILAFALIFAPSITNWLGVNDIKNYLFWYLSGLVIGDTDVFVRLKSLITSAICLICGISIFVACGNRAYNSFVAVFMLMGIMLLCMHMNLEKVNFLNAIGKHSFSIFLLSWPAQVVIEVVGNRILHLPIVINTTVMFCSGILIPLIIVLVIKRLESIPCFKKIELLLGM